MIEKIITVPAMAGYYVGKAGARQGAKLLPRIKNYIAPVQSVDDINYYSRIESRGKNKDIKEYVEKNPEKKANLEECINKVTDNNRVARRWAGVIDTVDKVTAPVGMASCYLIYMGGVGFPLGIAEEAVEMAALKGPFMAYYAKKNGLKGIKRIPGWLAYELFSHLLPLGDALDLRNNYVNSVDKDIENAAVDLFRKQEGLQKQGWLKRLWGKKKAPSPEPQALASSKDDKKMEFESGCSKLADPGMPENRLKLYLNSLQEDCYESFMQEKGNSLPQSLERFVDWGFNPRADVKWYSNPQAYLRNVQKIADVVDKHLGDGHENSKRQISSAYELNIGGERKYVIEFENVTCEDYSKAHDVPPGMVCPSVMVMVNRNYKLIVDAETGRIEDSHVQKKEYHTGLLDPLSCKPLDKKLETQVPGIIEAGPKQIEELVGSVQGQQRNGSAVFPEQVQKYVSKKAVDATA